MLKRWLEPLVRELFDQFIAEILPDLVKLVRDQIDRIDGEDNEDG